MRYLRWPARTGSGFLAVAVLLGAGSCRGGRNVPKPVAAIASSPQAAAAFEAIRDAWNEPPEEVPPAKLRAMLEAFVTQFPNDGLNKLARVALSLVAMKEGDFATADMQMTLTEGLPPGTTQDLWMVARARRWRLQGRPEAALELLRPLVGKNVDPLARSVFEEELTLSALATHRDYEAISYMDAWLRVTPEEDREATAKTVTAMVQKLPKEVLVGALEAMRSRRASFGYGIDIERILAGRLVQIATTSGDAELARMLLDPSAGAVVVPGDAGVELGELAQSRRGLNIVAGRTIGLLLPTESPALRDESADVLRGVMWAVGLPRGVRTAEPLPTPTPDGGLAASGTCAPLDPAPELSEPRPEEGVHLATRNDAGSADRTEVSLDELAGEGAAIVIAGLDPQTATRALRWGENHDVPVIALAASESGDPEASFGFELGELRADVVRALARAAPSLSTEAVAPVVDASEVSLYAPQGGRLDGLMFAPPLSCDMPAARAGEPRFPIAQWEHDKTRAWLVSGSPQCAAELVAELSTARARGTIALTLEAAALPTHSPGLRVLSAAAGVVPESASVDERVGELRRFSATLGRVGWWTALGRDAATLARAAVAKLPLDTVSDLRAVTARRTSARDFLGAASARLWTTEASGWAGSAHTLKRTVCAVDSPAVEARRNISGSL
jgi:hypothetical protein